MRASALLVLPALLGAALFGPPAHAQAKPTERTLLYVDDVGPADKALAGDATALTSALCAAFSKDRRLDVMCAPDVRQILGFAATAAMVGTASSPGTAITERLDRTQVVVSSSLRKEASAFVLVIKGGPKAADARAEAMYTDQPRVALEQRADTQKKLLDALPSLCGRVIEGLLKPAPSAAPTPPPPPLEAAPRPGG